MNIMFLVILDMTFFLLFSTGSPYLDLLGLKNRSEAVKLTYYLSAEVIQGPLRGNIPVTVISSRGINPQSAIKVPLPILALRRHGEGE